MSKLSEFFDGEKNISLFNLNTYFIFSSFIYRGYTSILINFIEVIEKKTFIKISLRIIMILTLIIFLPIYYIKRYAISLRRKIYES